METPRHIVFVHYHLRAGGVTRVLAREIRALRMADPSLAITVVTGEAVDLSFGEFSAEKEEKTKVQIVVCPALDYYSAVSDGKEAAARYASILHTLKEQKTESTLFHIHNGSLGKNPALTHAVATLVAEEEKVYLHCHDFAEDRPVMMANLKAYFDAEVKTCSFGSFL